MENDNFAGKIIRGYELQKPIGVGGFGAVYKAHQLIIDREVAVKVVHERYARQADFIRRFEAEARTIARLEHMNIVPLYDYWREPVGAFLVMRWLRGGSARTVLDDYGPWPIDAVVKLLDQMAAALSVAHQHGVIHRDIKPENILLDEDNNSFLSDFGISVNIFTDPDDVMTENLSFGSPAYMAPEQLIRRAVTPLADIYSTGILIYELLTGELPFPETETEILAKRHAQEPIPSLKLRRPELPDKIDSVIWRATAKVAGARYQDAMSLAWDFREAARSVMGQGDLPRSAPFISGLMSPRDRRERTVGTQDLTRDTGANQYGSTLPLNAEPSPDGTLDMDMSQAPPIDPGRTTDLDVVSAGKETLDFEEHYPESTGEYATEPLNQRDPISTDEIPTGPVKDRLSTPDMETARITDDAPAIDSGTMDISKPVRGFGLSLLRNPYKGLRPFEEFDAGDFFGRNDSVVRLLNTFIDDSDSKGGSRFLALIGPSGSGKSSIVKAGLIPKMRLGGIQGSERWFIISMVLGADPYQELSEALLRVALDEPPDLKNRLREDPGVLHEVINSILPDDDTELLLFIDQFEEIFTLTTDEEDRANFLAAIENAVTRENSRIRIIITLRADFYDRPLQYKAFAELLRANTEVVLPLSVAELELTITGPAMLAGLTLDPGLSQMIVQDVYEQPGALPLLQYALTELYERRDVDRLTRAAYQEIGGVSGALARRADEIYQELSEEEQAAARQLFLRLITLESGLNATRQRVLWGDLFSGMGSHEAAERVIDQFVEYRLLTLDRDPLTRSPTVEIAHEALIKAWERLNEWIDQNRSDIQKRQRLQAATVDWLRGSRDNSFLARGARLAEFELLIEDSDLALSDEEIKFVGSSVALRKRGARIAQAIATAFTVFGVVALVLALIAFDQQRQAEEASAVALAERDRANVAANVSRSRELAATTLSVLRRNDLALLLGVEALRVTDTFEARSGLLDALQANPFVSAYLNGNEARVRSVDYSPDGTRVVAGDASGAVFQWDAETLAIIGEPIRVHEQAVNEVMFNSDGTRIVSASDDGTVMVHDAETGESLVQFADYEGDVWAAAFSPDDIWVAGGDENGQVIVWDVQTGDMVQALDAHTGIVYSIAFSPSSEVLATAGEDYTVRLWDTSTWELLVDPIQEHTNWVITLAFSPDGDTLASSGADRTIMLWDMSGMALIDRFETGHTGWIRDLAFNGDGRFLASAAEDGQIRMWNVAGRQPALQPLTAHVGQVWGVDFHPQDLRVVTGSADSNVILWEIALPTRPGIEAIAAPQAVAVMDSSDAHVAVGGEAGRLALYHMVDGRSEDDDIHVIDAHEGAITALAFAPSGDQVLTIGEDRTGVVWDVETGESVLELPVGELELMRTALYTADGTQIITGDDTGFVRMWDAVTGEAVRDPMRAHEDGTLALAITSAGGTLAAGGRDGTIILLDVATGEVIGDPLEGHTDAINSLLFNEAGDTLVSSSRDSSIIIWDVASGTPRQQPLQGHSDWVLSTALSPDEMILASGGRDNNVILWDFETGRMIGNPLTGHSDWVRGVAFAATGDYLFSSGRDSSIITWSVSPESWRALACQISNRDLTLTEWNEYFPDEEYRSSCAEGGVLE